jgi:hypothetical protein
MTIKPLIDWLTEAEKGSPKLNRMVFVALGGEIRREPTSKQGGDLVSTPYWPDQKDPPMGLAFTTSLEDIVAEVERRGHEWSIDSFRREDGSTVYCGFVCGTPTNTPTNVCLDAPSAALSLCIALIKTEGLTQFPLDQQKKEGSPELSS